MNDKFTEREKSFEKKFAKDEELQFKVQARSNKYIAEFVCSKLGKSEDEKKKYVHEIIEEDMKEAGTEDVFRKIKDDLAKAGFNNIDDEIRNKMNELMDRAKKDFS